jgi:hypothetical protein
MSLLAALLAGAASVAGVFVPTDAHASVSIAVGYDALVQDADSVGVVTPTETKSVWEDGRIVTYTRVKVEQGVAGELGTGGEGWVRTMGGVVGKIGQMVDGEPVFTTGKTSLIFLRKFKQGGTWEVSARAQGQYPVITEELAQASPLPPRKVRKVTRSTSVGVLYPPKAVAQAAAEQPGPVTAPGVSTKAFDPKATATEATKVRLAGEVLHDRPLEDVTREIAGAWKRLHPAAAASDSKK